MQGDITFANSNGRIWLYIYIYIYISHNYNSVYYISSSYPFSFFMVLEKKKSKQYHITTIVYILSYPILVLIHFGGFVRQPSTYVGFTISSPNY